MRRQRIFDHPIVSRRQVLQGIGAVSLLSLGGPSAFRPAAAQTATPKPGGVARVRGYDPLGWDAMLTVSYRTHIPISYTHNRLFRYKPGADVPVGKMLLEPDLVERWEEPSDTRYILHLRQGVLFHNKPPVGGRELVAEDVRYSIERFLTVAGNNNSSLLEDIDSAKVLDKYTVQVDLKQPNVWLLDYLADASILPIIPQEVIDQFGHMRKPEAVIGTGPWMLTSYEPKVKSIFVKNPTYFRPGLPYLDEIHFIVIDDDSTASAAYMSGQLDFGWQFVSTIRLEELEEFNKRHPDWHYEPFLWNVQMHLYMHTDQPPFNDQRVRQAISMAMNRQEMIDTIGHGQGKMDTAVPASLTQWHLPVDQLGAGATYHQYNPQEARRLLKEAGHPNGFTASMLVFTGYGAAWADIIDLVANYLREVGINVQIVNKEYGAYIKTLTSRNYDDMVLALHKPYVIPDGFVYDRYQMNTYRNLSFVDDAKLRELAQAQRREKDPARRKALLDALSREEAQQQYYIHFTSGVYVASWPSYVKNFNTNLGYDYGARMEAAWFEKS
jgi:peptide/nickel transport system substrate-binding protein